MTRLDRLAHSGASKLELSALFLEILSYLYKSVRTRSVAQGIAAFLASKRREEIDLALLSSHFHFSKNHIINLFKSEYGVTPMEYLDRLRLEEAQWLLESSGASVEDIAYDCGFGSYSNFYRRFCAYCGSSPRQWRDEKRRALEKRLEEQEK
jgi:AraC-like DNA-binding protein